MEEKTRKILLTLVVILIVTSIYLINKEKPTIKNYPEEKTYPKTQNNSFIQQKQEQFILAPELEGITGYINTNNNLTIKSLKGKVVLVDFWTYSCINCLRTLPYLVSWNEKYADKGLVIIGVHTPEFGFEKEYENVLQATKEHAITYPVVLDNDYATWTAYHNRFWPRKYLVDAEGFIRFDHIGEGGYEETEEQIRTLLEEAGQQTNTITITKDNTSIIDHFGRTPELYLGYDYALNRGQNIGNKEGLIPREEQEYARPTSMKQDVVYLEGLWKSNSDNVELVGTTGKVYLKFSGKQAHVVADAKNQSIMKIKIDNEITGQKTINHPDLYTAYDGEYGTYTLTLEVQQGFTLNSFTFG